MSARKKKIDLCSKVSFFFLVSLIFVAQLNRIHHHKYINKYTVERTATYMSYICTSSQKNSNVLHSLHFLLNGRQHICSVTVGKNDWTCWEFQSKPLVSPFFMWIVGLDFSKMSSFNCVYFPCNSPEVLVSQWDFASPVLPYNLDPIWFLIPTLVLLMHRHVGLESSSVLRGVEHQQGCLSQHLHGDIR